MKKLLFLLFALCVFLSSCGSKAGKENQATSSQPADTMAPADILKPDPIVLKEPIVYSMKHCFSDTASMDSFVMEMPAGTLVADSKVQLRIYNSKAGLLFTDSFSAETFAWDGPMPPPDEFIANLRKGISRVCSVDSFSQADKIDAIKNASAAQIVNMVAWNEAVADGNKTVFKFNDYSRGNLYVVYSDKLKKPVVMLEVYVAGPMD